MKVRVSPGNGTPAILEYGNSTGLNIIPGDLVYVKNSLLKEVRFVGVDIEKFSINEIVLPLPGKINIKYYISYNFDNQFIIDN